MIRELNSLDSLHHLFSRFLLYKDHESIRHSPLFLTRFVPPGRQDLSPELRLAAAFHARFRRGELLPALKTPPTLFSRSWRMCSLPPFLPLVHQVSGTTHARPPPRRDRLRRRIPAGARRPRLLQRHPRVRHRLAHPQVATTPLLSFPSIFPARRRHRPAIFPASP